jgi:hypothetical protein
MWATKEGQARWTLILDDATRRASPLHPPTTMPMRKDYHDIIALANDVGCKQAFMLYYGQICGSAAASFDAHGHDERCAAYDHFKGTLEAAWSSTTVDADLTSCSR